MNGRINILLFWHYNDWGLYGRTYERLAFHLSQLPEVGNVVCIFPPIINKNKYRLPFHCSKVSPSLYLLELCSNVVRTEGQFWRLRQWINKNIPDMLIIAFLKLLRFKEENTMLWLFPPHPYLEHIKSRIPHIFSIAHVVDDFSKLGKDFWLYDSAVSQYPKLGELSDIIIVNSQQNYEKFSQISNNCLLFENAVDSFFINDSPCKAQKNNCIVVGYIGWITERTDLELIEYLAIKRPQWKIVIAGPQYSNIPESLKLLNNINFPGQIPYREVPKLINSFDVCIIPHVDNEYSRSMSPLKLYQYLASGVPIVSTNVAGISAYKKYVKIADSYDEFIAAIDHALENDTISDSLERVSIAKQQTWESRTKEVFATVLNKLGSKINEN